MKRLLILAVCAVIFAAAPAAAKEGLYLGGYIPINDIDLSGVESGSGWGLRIGNGLNRYFSVEVGYSETSHDATGGLSYDMTTVALDLRINFPLTTLDSNQIMSLEPYILLGAGAYDLSGDTAVVAGADSSVKGTGTQFGFGIELYLFHELSVHAGWTKANMSFTSGTGTAGDIDADVTTLDFGVIYHFL